MAWVGLSPGITFGARGDISERVQSYTKNEKIREDKEEKRELRSLSGLQHRS
jgi:hypothetical protein